MMLMMKLQRPTLVAFGEEVTSYFVVPLLWIIESQCCSQAMHPKSPPWRGHGCNKKMFLLASDELTKWILYRLAVTVLLVP